MVLNYLVRTQIAREALLPPRDVMACCELVPETKGLHKRAILQDVCVLQVLEETFALADHLEESATPMMILGVGAEVTRQVVDALCEQSDLYAGRTGVPFVGPVLVNRGCLIERHRRKFLGATGAQGASLRRGFARNCMKHGSLLHFALSVKDRPLPERYLGRQIGKYRVTRLIGGGAFAWVYEAVDRDLEIPVALKILRPEFSGNADADARFRREATTAARLRHPNIVTVRDVGQVDGASFVAMDLLPLSLARRLELLPRLPETDVVRIGLEVAAALSIAHAGGIVHRDIKPDNILIGTHGEGVVADFGLARALDGNGAHSASDHVMGTPHYFSPEQARGLELDGRSDLYALGVTMFRAATGRLPFEGDDWYAVARQHVEAPVPSARAIVPELSVAFDQVIDRLLRKAPADRYASAVDLADALATLASAPHAMSTPSVSRSATETVTTFQPLDAPIASRSPTSRALTQRASMAAAVLVILAGIGWVAWRPGVAPVNRTGANTNAPSPVRDPVASLTPDSSTPRPDTAARVVADTTSVTPVRPLPTPPKATDPTRRKAAALVRTQLAVSSSDSAAIYVDGQFVGKGSVMIERPGAARLALRAVVVDAPENCRAAERDSTVKLNVGEKRSIVLAVRTCLTVTYSATPADARVRFESLDGGSTNEVRADSIKRVILLPEGRYEVRATAPHCFEYRGDTLVVRRGASGASLSRSIRMAC
jgi:serine/threonine-protein kinase